MTFEEICVVGIGGVGGFFGGRMASSARSRQIYFIARGAHLEKIQRSGLTLNIPAQTGMVCRPAFATDNILEIPTPDLYLVCVKSYDLNAILQSIRKNMRTNTVILPLLNGVDVCERIRAVLTGGIVLPACVYIGTHIESPGVITQKGGDGTVLCGPDPQFPDFDPQQLCDLFRESGLLLQWNPDPYPAIWQKFVFIAGFGLVTAQSRKTLGEIMADEWLKDRVRAIMEEVVAIGRRKGIALPENLASISLNKGSSFPPETRTSYQRDVEAGKRNEGDLFGGTIIRMGLQTGVPTPATSALYTELQKD